MAEIPLGFTFDTIEVGQISRTHGRTITETDISFYMMLTGGWHPVHCDKEFMRKNGLGPVRAQGSLGIALALGSHLESSVLEGADEFVKALGVDEWSYNRPLVAGDTFHLEVEIVGKKLMECGRKYKISRKVRLINQNNEVLQEGVASSMWQRSL